MVKLFSSLSDNDYLRNVVTGVEGADHVAGVWMVPATLDEVALDPLYGDLM